MSQFDYQVSLANKILKSLERQSKPVVLASTTSSGKSYTTARVLEDYLSSDQTRTAVFLGSNLTVLAQQFYSILENEFLVSFSFSMLKSQEDAQLKIGLPQQLIKRPRKISLLVLDEAQLLWSQVEKNESSMLSKIIKTCMPDQILLLSGSPTYFTERKGQYCIHYLSYEQIPNDPSRVFSNLIIDVISVEDRSHPDEALRKFLSSVSRNKDDISKFVVATRNIKEAEQVKDILESAYNIRATISTSRHDKDSENLKDFTDECQNYQCCITVNRISAGWSYGRLNCILDLRASQNLCNSFQLISRLFRVNQQNPNASKAYYRVTTKANHNNTVLFLHKVMALTEQKIFEGATSNGKNIKMVAV